MAKIWIVAHHYVELELAIAEVQTLQQKVTDLWPVPRKPNHYYCSLKYIPEVLQILRGWNEDECPSDAAREVLMHELTRRRMTQELKQNGTTVDYPGLWEHQNLGVELAKYNDRFNFFYDTRTGKTRMAYQIIYNAIAAGKVKRALVIVPSTIIPSWLEDAQQFPLLKVVAYYGDENQKQLALSTPSHVVLWSTGMIVKSMPLVQKIKFDMVFLDESSKCKSHKTKIAQALLEYSGQVNYWYNLSATPAPNGEHEYFTQMAFVDRYLLSSTWTQFEHKYFDNVSPNQQWKKLMLKQNMRHVFMSRINACSIYIDQKVMPMAGSSWIPYEFQMDEDTWTYYEDMRKNLAATMPETDEMVVADSAVIARAKLQQITSGFVMDTEAIRNNEIAKKLELDEMQQTIYRLPNQPRIRALQELLASIGNESVVIWAHYKQEFEDIKALLGDKCVIVRGGTSSVEKNQAVDAFKRKKVQYIVAHPLSIGMGINLTVSYICVYYRTTDSWEALKQSSERIRAHINIQPHDCIYYVLLANSPIGGPTVDNIVFKNVSNKREVSTEFLKYLRSGKYEGKS